MRRTFPATLGLVIVIGTSVVHGYWTDRWGVGEKVRHAADAMDGVPMEVGDWVGETLTPRGRDDQGLPGQLYRRYTNRKTGDIITVALVCGRPGPVSIHTPDVCYGASGYKVGKRVEHEPKGFKDPVPRFYTADMTRTTPTEEYRQRLFWAWRSDGKWQVAEDPRSTFARQPYLYKFYIARDLSAAVPLDTDPCGEFLRQILPVLDRVLD